MDMERNEPRGVDMRSGKATERLRDQTSTVAEDLRELGRLTKDAAKEKLGEARQVASDYYEQGRERVGELEQQVEGYVRQRPMTAILIAAGAGALLGFLLSRRR